MSNARAATELKYDLPEGTRFKFSQRDAMNLDLTMVLGEQQMNTQMVVDNLVSGEQTVLADQGGIPTKVKITFDPGLATKMTMMGNDQTTPFALAGKTVTVTRPVGGEATVDTGGVEVDDAVKKSVGDLVDYNPADLPPKPLEVGESYKPKIPPRAGEIDKADMTVTLVRVSDRGGRQVAELRADGQFTGDMEGMKVEGTRSGPMLVDLATGLVLDSTLDGKMTLNGTQEQGGMKVTMDGTGTGSSSATGEILSGGGSTGGTTATASSPTSSATPTPAPAATAAPAQTPAATAAASGSATLAPGSYAGDGLTVTVLPNNELAMTRGPLTMTGRVTSMTGDALSGTFTHEGNAYEFTGTKTPAGMTLTTGGKTYTLQKAGSNPLGD